MSGYNGFSKSNNAVDAESEGRYPASVLARRLGVKAGAIKALVGTSEWHHSSKFFRCVAYYDMEAAEEIIDELRAWKPEVKVVDRMEGCTGSYIEWGGTRRHPKAREISFGPVPVTRKGDWFVLHMPFGDMRKNKDTRGFHLRDSEGRRLNFNQ